MADAAEFNFFTLKQGDDDPVLNRKIEVLICKTQHYIVYLDDKMTVQWSGNAIPDSKELGEILNKVSILEGSSSFIQERESLEAIRGHIAEGVARCLEKNIEQARAILEVAEKTIAARNIEASWHWYFNFAYAQGLLSTGVIVVSWWMRDYLVKLVGLTAFQVFLCALVGAIGSVLSVASRSNRIQLDANAGRKLHLSEATARTVVGFFGGAFVCLMIKAGFFFDAFKPNNPLAMLLSIAFVAGAGERLIPNSIKKIEDETGG